MLSATRITIAVNLKATGQLSGDVDIHQPLLDSIVDDFRSGKTNRLILPNRAITRFEKINDVLELVP